MGKNNTVSYAVTLGAICLFAAALLTGVHSLTQPKIEAQMLSRVQEGLRDVFPAAERFEPIEEDGQTVYYKAFDGKNTLLGLVFQTSRRGYSSDIVTLAGMDQEGVVVRIRVLSQNETPGLGTRVTEVDSKKTGGQARPWFQAQFDGKKVDTLDTSVDAITGATITSRAVIDAVQEKGKAILKKVKNG